MFERIRLLGSQCDDYRKLRVKTYFAITVRREGRKRLLRFAVLVLFLPKLWIRAWAFSPARFCWSHVTITVAARYNRRSFAFHDVDLANTRRSLSLSKCTHQQGDSVVAFHEGAQHRVVMDVRFSARHGLLAWACAREYFIHCPFITDPLMPFHRSTPRRNNSAVQITLA
jgi:hypothetical protein